MSKFFSSARRLFSHSFSAQVRTASNLIANVYALIVGIVFVPLYINYIGVEAYGIIGAFNGLTAFFWLFDFGIATNLNRELAGFYQQEDKRELLDLKKSLEIICYALSGTIFLVLLGFITLLAYYWFNTDKFTPEYLLSVLTILACSLALQFPVTFYTNGLMGLNKQVSINFISISANTIKFAGAYFAIVYFEDKFRAFLVAQLIVIIFQVIALKFALSSFIRIENYRASFRLDALKKIKKFTSELFANNLVTILLSQSDKIILSRILTLEQFGYYMLAYSIATMTLGLFSNSTINVIFPNFSRLVAQENIETLKKNFHLSTQLTAWGMVSITAVLFFFSYEILLIWTGNTVVAENTKLLLSLFALSVGFDILTLVLYYLQLSFGRSNISFRFNLISFIFTVPALIIAATYFGAVGGVVCYLLRCVIYIFTFVPTVRNNFLNFSLTRWYLKDVGNPLIAGFAVCLVFWYLVENEYSKIALFFILAFCSLSVSAASLFMTDLPEYFLKNDLFYKLKSKFIRPSAY